VPKSAREAYGRFARFVGDRARMAAFIRERIESWEKEMQAILKFDLPSLTTETYHRTPAMIRAETAFGAATLIELGGEHLRQGLELANTVLGAVQENGGMYSTLDSVAAITLLSVLRRVRLAPGSSDVLCRIDGREMTMAEALKLERITRVEALDVPLQVEVRRIVEEDYTALDHGVSARVTLEREGRTVKGALAPGDAVELVVEVTSGYEAGDLVHVFLPDALSWVHGGGQIKRFSLDLQGQSLVRVPLAATGVTVDAEGQVRPQHYAVCVRNMYDEERGRGFADLAVTVAHRGDEGEGEGEDGLAGRVWKGLKALF